MINMETSWIPTRMPTVIISPFWEGLSFVDKQTHEHMRLFQVCLSVKEGIIQEIQGEYGTENVCSSSDVLPVRDAKPCVPLMEGSEIC